MISKNKIKLIKSLSFKKYRIQENSFLVEGDKIVSEVLKTEYRIVDLFATREFLLNNKKYLDKAGKVFEATPGEIEKASLLKNPQNCIAICELPAPDETTLKINNGLALYLDGIQDPGNLGTIIRMCDWFGVEQLFCSEDTTDIYNPKVIQATMGSFCRVNTNYSPFKLIENLSRATNVPIFGAFLEGKNIYTQKIPGQAIIVLGNEGNGIRTETAQFIKNKIKIPDFSKTNNGAESLNVAVAAGIICAEIKRQNTY